MKTDWTFQDWLMATEVAFVNRNLSKVVLYSRTLMEEATNEWELQTARNVKKRVQRLLERRMQRKGEV